MIELRDTSTVRGEFQVGFQYILKKQSHGTTQNLPNRKESFDKPAN